jgi:hypothetical protein
MAMTTRKRITIRPKPITISTLSAGDQGVNVSDIAICSKNGMNIRVSDNDIVTPDTDCFFYVKLDLPWNRPDGSQDYEEIISDGNTFYIAFRSLGQQRLQWTKEVQNVVLNAIQKFVEEI